VEDQFDKARGNLEKYLSLLALWPETEVKDARVSDNYKFLHHSVKQSSTSKGLSKHKLSMRAFLRAERNWLHHCLHEVSRNRIGKK